MNTAYDRANRIAGWSARGRDLLWIMSMIILSHLVIFAIIGAGWNDVFLPISVYIIFMTIMGIMGAIDGMNDIASIAKDADEEEKKTHAWKRFDETQWGAFKGLLVIWFGLTAISELYIMWFV